jgi:soluble lytic murein transglycosylase-like protein
MNKTLSLPYVIFGLLLNQAAISAEVYLNVSSKDEIRITSDFDDKEAIKISDATHPDHGKHPLAFRTKIDASKPLSIAAKYQSATQLPYHEEVILAANATALEPALIHAVIAVESGHNPKARSNKGAFGLMQLMPATAQQYAIAVDASPSKNILAGARYLRTLLDAFNGDLPLALAAYNAGPNAVKKYQGKIPPYAETQRYVPKVLVHYQQFAKKAAIQHLPMS